MSINDLTLFDENKTRKKRMADENSIPLQKSIYWIVSTKLLYISNYITSKGNRSSVRHFFKKLVKIIFEEKL